MGKPIKLAYFYFLFYYANHTHEEDKWISAVSLATWNLCRYGS